MRKISILFSGRGSNAYSILKFILDNKLKFEVDNIICNNIKAEGIKVISKLKLNVKIIDKKNQFFSRIHVEDIANVLFRSLQKFKSNEIYNVSDDKPTPSEELISYGCKLLNIEKPKIAGLSTIENEMVKNFYKDSKKVNNNKMKIFFDYKLKYPTYVEGLNHAHNDTT